MNYSKADTALELQLCTQHLGLSWNCNLKLAEIKTKIVKSMFKLAEIMMLTHIKSAPKISNATPLVVLL